MQQEPLTPVDRELEAALGRLRPAPPNLDRDQMMFRAGQASTRRHMHAWQGAAAVLALAVTISLGVRPTPPTSEHRIDVTADASRPTAATTPAARPGRETLADAPTSFLSLRRAVLTGGVDAIAPPAPATVPAPNPVAPPPLHLRSPLPFVEL